MSGFGTLGRLMLAFQAVATLALSVYAQTQAPLRGASFNDGTTKHAINSELSEFITNLMNSSGIPGISLGIVHTSRDKVQPEVELKSWGRMTENGDGSDLSPDALFDLASCSKAFLASAVGILMDDFAQGRNVTPLPDGVTRFDWQTKVNDLLPDEWALDDEWASVKTNIRDTLSHVTGMPRHDYSYAPGDTLSGLVKNLRNLRPAYELRQKWSYNNQMFKTGAYIISKYSGKPYTAFASERLFAPMNMTHTTFWPNEAREAGLLTEAWTKFGRLIPFWFDEEVVELMAGAGGIISSAEEMTKWLTVLLNKGIEPTSNETIVPRSAFDEITTGTPSRRAGRSPPRHPSRATASDGGACPIKATTSILTHSGAIPGFSTRVAFLPEDGLGVVVLANADEKAKANEASSTGGVRADASGMAVFEDEPDASQEDQQNSDPAVAPDPLPIDLDAFSGTYTNPGYGALILCSTQSTSHHCLSVLSSFAPFISPTPFPSPIPVPAPAPQTTPELYAAWPRIWSTHVRLSHTAGTDFGLQFTALFPEGYGENRTAFETSETGESEGRAVFVLEGEGEKARVLGFGMEIDAEAVEARKRAGAGDAKGWADAWFERV
ncbi:beta-lactamase/transpeptidase-like protein [Fomitopsis serialis]|uniref:beta-lactamase/transpeptidase-like protein n=1 Tax=Fomitopsis serialis TaxID=139415 RepID=UPI002007FCAB|nr:beta-lactamase/transpeptidase-like protein [Neoantrodia serialis]KAH9919588.1 beta-lactamase/transpeptidase-like protein [Neoantrodia serialis]